MRLEAQIAQISSQLENTRPRDGRCLIALVGPPASGKSTLSEALVHTLPQSAVVPMDGFHLDNRLLDARNLRAQKGSPDSFDALGFLHLIKRLKTEPEVVYPVFDRAIDTSIAGAAYLEPDVRTVIVEGNYLLLDRPHWRDLAPLWDLSIYLAVPRDELRARLMERWRTHGFDEAAAAEKTDTNDLPNADFVAAHLIAPDITITNTAGGYD